MRPETIWPITQIENLDKFVGRFVWKFIQRNGRPSLRRLLWLSLLLVFVIEAPCIMLLALLMDGDVLGTEQAMVIGFIAIAFPLIVLLGGLIAASAHGVMGRPRSIGRAAIYTIVFFAAMLFATSWIGFPSSLVQTLYAVVATSFCVAASFALGKKCIVPTQ